MLLLTYYMKVVNDESCSCCWMATPRETPMLSKSIRALIYKQKLSTQHQIMALCPFYKDVSVDKEIIRSVKFSCVYDKHELRTNFVLLKKTCFHCKNLLKF